METFQKRADPCDWRCGGSEPKAAACGDLSTPPYTEHTRKGVQQYLPTRATVDLY